MQSNDRASSTGRHHSSFTAGNCSHPTSSYTATPVPQVMPSHDQYTTHSQNMFSSHIPSPLQSPNPKIEATQGSFIDTINRKGRLFTGLDACASGTWDTHPEIQHRYDALPQEYKDIFDHCQPHHQVQSALIDFLEWVPLNPGRNPPPELLHGLCRCIPAENPKKRWACGMRGCQKIGDTLEHLRSHLQGRAHFNFQFYQCDFCPSAFHLKHDKNRHIRTKHTSHQVEEQEDDQADGDYKTGVQRARSKTRKIRNAVANAPISGRRGKTQSSSPEQRRIPMPRHEAVSYSALPAVATKQSRELPGLASPPPPSQFLDLPGPTVHPRTNRSPVLPTHDIPTAAVLRSPYANEPSQAILASAKDPNSHQISPKAYSHRLSTPTAPLNQKSQSNSPMSKIQDISLPRTDPDYEFLKNFGAQPFTSQPMPQATNQILPVTSMSYVPTIMPTVSGTANPQDNVITLSRRTSQIVSTSSSSHENIYRNAPSQTSISSLPPATPRRPGRPSKTKGR